jgi:hypothetical protein
VLGDHHPPRRVRHGQRLVERTIDDQNNPPPWTRTGQKPQRPHLPLGCRRSDHSSVAGRDRAKWRQALKYNDSL